MDKIIHSFYNENAITYDVEQNAFRFVRFPEMEIALNTINKTAEKQFSVLEIGAGTGRFTLEIAPLVKNITAIDLSENMLNVMSLKAKEIGITNITQHCGDFLALPLKKKYDMIVSFSAIEYIQDIEALFDKIDELLKPGGYLILTTSHNTFFRWWGRMGNYFRQGIFMVAYSKKQMKKNLESRGIKILGIKDLCMKFLFVKGILLFVYARK